MRCVRIWTIRVLTLMLLWTLVPGLVEATEDALHLVLTGQVLAVDFHAGESSEPDAEHGCTGALHLCTCHVSPTGLNGGRARIPAVGEDVGCLRILGEDSTCLGHSVSLDRPPQS